MQNLISRIQHGLYLRKHYVTIEDLPFSFAHISDLHFDSTGKFPTWLQHDLLYFLLYNPTDVLVVSGDLLDNKHSDPKQALDFLFSLPVNYVVCTTGNHDEPKEDSLFNILPAYSPKIHLSINSNFYHKGINFITYADLHSRYYNHSFDRLVHNYNNNCFNVVLSHNPQSFWDIYKLGKQVLIVSGHTHGGQILYADFLRHVFSNFISHGKILNTLRINHEHDCFKLQGVYKQGCAIMSINNGLGTHPPGRLFCPPTITIYK